MPARDRDLPPGRTATVVIPVLEPDPNALALTLDSVARQDFPVEEVIIVDDSDETVDAEVEDTPVRVIPGEGVGQGRARQIGIEEASGEYIVHLDEDAVMLNESYISSGIATIESNDGAVASGGTVLPLHGNVQGDMIAVMDRLNPSTLGTHHLIHEKRLCANGGSEACFPVERRGEDITHRNALKERGGIIRMYDQPVMKDLPTQRQEKGINTILLSVAGGVLSGLVTSAVERGITRYGEDALEAAAEEIRG